MGVSRSQGFERLNERNELLDRLPGMQPCDPSGGQFRISPGVDVGGKSGFCNIGGEGL